MPVRIKVSGDSFNNTLRGFMAAKGLVYNTTKHAIVRIASIMYEEAEQLAPPPVTVHREKELATGTLKDSITEDVGEYSGMSGMKGIIRVTAKNKQGQEYGKFVDTGTGRRGASKNSGGGQPKRPFTGYSYVDKNGRPVKGMFAQPFIWPALLKGQRMAREILIQYFKSVGLKTKGL